LVVPAWGQIAAPIIPGMTVEIADVVQMPDTRGMGQEDSRSSNNLARINFLHELPDASGRWLVNDLRGQIYTVDSQTRHVTEYLDVGDEFDDFIIGPGGLSTGLIAATPHPDFATNGKFYTIHEEQASDNPATPDFQAVGNAGNIGSGQHGVVIEWTADNVAANVFSGTHREIMRIAQPAGNLHNLGDIGFNPLAGPGDADYGMMYLAGGDAGYDSEGRGDPQAQRMDSIFGKILRIDPAGSDSANGKYGIPTDNPHVDEAGSLPEIFATGFRNAHRILWDIPTETMFTTDIGQGTAEEINVLRGGGNYGWGHYEGTFLRGGGTPDRQPSDAFTFPAAQYDHGDGLAIAGGFVYRGSDVPALFGKFVYGDIVNGRLFYSDVAEMLAAEGDGNYLTTADVFELFLTRDGEPVDMRDLVRDALGGSVPNSRVDLRFGQTSDGEIYVTSKQDGWIRQFASALVAGDYNRDGIVNAADYVVWRNQQGTDFDLPNRDPELEGDIGLADYEFWQENFRSTAAGNQLVELSAVPEPSAAVLALMVACFASAFLQRGRRDCVGSELAGRRAAD
jgi:glucose/arabinose dehydrogenase